jgi:hypothetical protein
VTWQSPALLNGNSDGYDIAFDAQDNILMTGRTAASNDDTTDAFQKSFGGSTDGNALKYFPAGYPGDNHAGAHIVWGTYLGGTAHDAGFGIAANSTGAAYIVGQTSSPNFITSPLTQPMSTANDGFLLKLQTNSGTVTDGPNGTTSSRDVTFKYTSGETAGSFQCRLVGPGFSSGLSACGAQSQDFKGLADGAYTFELKAFDGAGTTNGSVTTRAFTVDTAPKASFTIAPNPALAGRAVAFDGSASNDPIRPITKYEWDLDGNGSYETDTATTATASQVYPAAGTFTIGLRVTNNEGKSGTTTGELHVNSPTGPGTQFGVTIDNGAQFTNSPDVVVTSTFPTFITSLLFSNDGGFGKAQTFAAKKDTKWKLDSSGPERLPKTIYVRFLTGAITGETHQDDIILDETPPKVDQAVVTGAEPSAAATAAKLRKYKVKVKARDAVSGVSKLQITANKKKPGKVLKYKTRLTVKAAKRPKWVRARDRAGNWSKWKRAR